MDDVRTSYEDFSSHLMNGIVANWLFLRDHIPLRGGFYKSCEGYFQNVT
jgi:hypothetical protein